MEGTSRLRPRSPSPLARPLTGQDVQSSKRKRSPLRDWNTLSTQEVPETKRGRKLKTSEEIHYTTKNSRASKQTNEANRSRSRTPEVIAYVKGHLPRQAAGGSKRSSNLSSMKMNPHLDRPQLQGNNTGDSNSAKTIPIQQTRSPGVKQQRSYLDAADIQPKSMVKGSGVKKNAVSLENYVLQPAKAFNGVHPSKKLQIPIATLALGDVGRGRVGSPQANQLMEQLHPDYAHQLAASFKRAKKLKEAVLVPNYPGLHLSAIPHQALHTTALTSPKLKQRIDQHILKHGLEKGGLDRESKSPTSTILNKPLKPKGKTKKPSKHNMTSPLKYLETEEDPAALTSHFKSVVDKYQELTRKRNQREAKFQLLQEKLLLEMATVVRESALHGPHTDSASRASDNLLAAAMHSKKYSLNSSHIKEAGRGNGDFHQSDQNMTANGVGSSKRVLKPGLPKPRPPRPAEGNGMGSSDMMKTHASEMHQTHHKQGLSTVSSLGSKQPVDRHPPESRQSSSGASGKRSLLDIVNAAATLIQKNVRGFLCRRNLSRLFRSVLMSSEHKDLFNQSENDLSSEDLDDQAERGDLLKHHILKNETHKSHKQPHRQNQGPQKPNFKKDKPKLSHDPVNYDQGDSKYYYDVGVKQPRQPAAQNGYTDHNGSHDPEPSDRLLNGGGGSNTFSDSSSFNQRVESQTTPRERSMLEMRKTQKKDYRDFTDSKSKDKSQKLSHQFEGKVLVDEFHRAEKLLFSEIQHPDSPSLSDSARERVKMRRTDQGSSFHKHKDHSDHKRGGKRAGRSEPTVVNKQVPTKPSEPDIHIDFNYDKHPQRGKKGTPSSASFDEQTEPLRGDLPMPKQSQMVNVATQMSKKSLPQVEKGVLTEPPEDSDFRRLGDILASSLRGDLGMSHQNKEQKEVQEGPSEPKIKTQTPTSGPNKVLPQIKSNRRLYEGASPTDPDSVHPSSQQELKNGPNSSMKPSQSRAQLDTFAKEQYMNWSQVDRLLSKMNSIQTKAGSREINEVFKQLEEIANINKMSLKSKFQIDPTLSQIQTEALSAGTEKDMQASFAGQMLDSKRSGYPQSEASSKRNPQGAATYTFSGGDMKNGSSAAPNSVFQNADQLPSNILKKSMDSISGGFSNSPLNISYAGSQTQKPIRKNSKDSVQEVWPENPWIQVQESVESKLEPFKNSDQKRLAFGLRGFGRDELSLSESVIRSSVVERETNQFNDFGTAERQTAKDQLVKGSPKATGLYSRLSGPHDALTLNTTQQARPGLINSPKTPIGQDDIIFESLITNQQGKKGREVPSRFEDELEGRPMDSTAPRLLQKTRSKKSIPRLVPLDELPESGRDELSVSKCEDDGLPKPQFNANLMKTYADWKAGPHKVTVQSLEKAGSSKPPEGPEGSRDKQEKLAPDQKPSETLVKNQPDKQSKIQAATVDNARSGPRLSPKHIGGAISQSSTPKAVPAAPSLPGCLTFWKSKPETIYIVNQSRNQKPNPPQLQDSNRSQGKVLQEANVALQSILDDINSFMEIEEVFIDSGRRDRGESRVWNDLENSISAEHSQIKYNIAPGPGSPILYPRNEVGQPVKKGTSSPLAGKPQQEGFSGHVNSFQGRTGGQAAKDMSDHRNAVVNTITDKVLETVVTEMLEDPSYYSLVKGANLPQSQETRQDGKDPNNPAVLEEAFLKIDEELLAYDDLPRSSAQSSKKKEPQSTAEAQSSKQNQPNSMGSIGEHATDETTTQPFSGSQKAQGNRNLEDLLDDLPDLDDLPAHDSETKKEQKKDEPKKTAEDKHDYSGDDEQSDAETVYGLRTNFNAVSEYLLILMKFLKDRQAELGLPGSKDSPDVVLKKAHLLELELQEYKNNDTKVVNVQIPPRTKKAAAEARALCFKRNTDPGSFLQAQHFLVLEEEILVGLSFMTVFLQGHEHHGRPGGHATSVSQGYL